MCVGYCWAIRPRELLARSPVVACSAKLLHASRSFLIPPGVVLVHVGWRCSKSQRDMLAAMHVCVRCPRKRETMNERTALFHMTVLSSDRDASDFASEHFDLGIAFHTPCRTHWISPLARDTFLGAFILTVVCTTYHLSQPFRGFAHRTVACSFMWPLYTCRIGHIHYSACPGTPFPLA